MVEECFLAVDIWKSLCLVKSQIKLSIKVLSLSLIKGENTEKNGNCRVPAVNQEIMVISRVK